MSVPLDRLYNFLHDVTRQNDILIYRFLPHGSRKIEDLTAMVAYKEQYSFKHRPSSAKFLFFYDQEPLNYDLYALPDLLDRVLESNKSFNNGLLNDDLRQQCRELLSADVMSKVNLRLAAIEHSLWLRPVLLVHSELRSQELVKYEDQDFIGIYWWAHAMIARDWFRYAEHDPNIAHKHATKDFLIYNRAWSGTREYRLKFTELLLENNLVGHCQTWFNSTDQDQSYQNHQFKNSDFQIKNYNLHQHFAPSQATGSSSADYHAPDYQNTNIEIVLETLFDDSRLQLTEKILRPIACGQPFLLMATHGSLEYLRRYGFGTFGDYIDESYDLILNPAQRLHAIVAEMRRIANLPAKEKTQLFMNMQRIADQNRLLFFSNAWQQSIVDEFKQNFDVALARIEQQFIYQTT